MSRKKILIANDEEEIRSLLAYTLGDGQEYKIVMAKDGEEALDKASQEKPDLVLLDIRMPKLNGYEVVKSLKADPDISHIKVIIVTTIPEESYQSKARACGVDDYFTVPFSPTRLLMKVRALLAKTPRNLPASASPVAEGLRNAADP